MVDTLPARRVNWKSYKHLFEEGLDDTQIAQAIGVSPDAARLARKRFEDPSDGFVGLRIGFFDLETTGLTAIMGRLLCASFSDSWGRIKTYRIDETTKRSLIDDRELAVKIRDELETYDIICGWNSKLFDVPFLNARLLKWGERPMRKDKLHLDMMYYARGQFARIGSSKLVNVQKFAPDVDATKSEVEWDTWGMAGMGDKDALEYVIEHCERDIEVLRQVFQQLKVHITTIHR